MGINQAKKPKVKDNKTEDSFGELQQLQMNPP